MRRTLLAGSWATCLFADKHLGHCRDQAEIIPRLIDATAHRQERAQRGMRVRSARTL
jgi:hypothetical protein